MLAFFLPKYLLLYMNHVKSLHSLAPQISQILLFSHLGHSPLLIFIATSSSFSTISSNSSVNSKNWSQLFLSVWTEKAESGSEGAGFHSLFFAYMIFKLNLFFKLI